MLHTYCETLNHMPIPPSQLSYTPRSVQGNIFSLLRGNHLMPFIDRNSYFDPLCPVRTFTKDSLIWTFFFLVVILFSSPKHVFLRCSETLEVLFSELLLRKPSSHQITFLCYENCDQSIWSVSLPLNET